MADGRLAYRLKTPWRDGTTHVVMERRELLERLAPLIPPPRAHQVRYYGVLAPCASGRDKIVPAGSGARDATPSRRSAAESETGSTVAVVDPRDGEGEGEALVDRAFPAVQTQDERHAAQDESRARRIAWADLLKRVFEVDALRCPNCGGRMRLIAAITEASVAQRILESLALPPRAPPIASAEALDLGPGPIDRAIAGTLVERQEDPGWDFDQSAEEVPIEDEGS